VQFVTLRSPTKILVNLIGSMAMDMDPIAGHVPAIIILTKNGRKS
jgi:hypothetical protein